MKYYIFEVSVKYEYEAIMRDCNGDFIEGNEPGNAPWRRSISPTIFRVVCLRKRQAIDRVNEHYGGNNIRNLEIIEVKQISIDSIIMVFS